MGGIVRRRKQRKRGRIVLESITYNMDCMEYMKSLPDKVFDLAVVDPQYGISVSNNIGRRKGDKHSAYKKIEWDDSPPPPEYFEQLIRVSKNQIIFGANHFVELIPNANSPCWILWDKGFSEDVSFASFEMAWTSFKSPSKRVALSSAQKGRIHPTQKPVALYAWIFSRYANQGDKILDTHLGSGSSRIAAYDAGLDFVGCEIDPDYFDLEEQRFERHTAQVRFDV
nr:MAG TPA: adenine specific DNA methyltransferase [Caudoviricetes sp.]